MLAAISCLRIRLVATDACESDTGGISLGYSLYEGVFLLQHHEVCLKAKSMDLTILAVSADDI